MVEIMAAAPLELDRDTLKPVMAACESLLIGMRTVERVAVDEHLIVYESPVDDGFVRVARPVRALDDWFIMNSTGHLSGLLKRSPRDGHIISGDVFHLFPHRDGKREDVFFSQYSDRAPGVVFIHFFSRSIETGEMKREGRYCTILSRNRDIMRDAVHAQSSAELDMVSDAVLGMLEAAPAHTSLMRFIGELQFGKDYCSECARIIRHATGDEQLSKLIDGGGARDGQ
jgi:hypothetical protein